MKISVQLVVCDDAGHEATFTDVAVLKKRVAGMIVLMWRSA
jgi:hypothetical protein